MSEKLKGIVKLSEERYWEMYNAGTLDPYKQYETPQEPTYSQAQIDKKLNTKANVSYVEDVKQELQDQITTATGGEFTKVLVGGVYQPLFNADTKANADDIPTKTSDLTNDSGFITEEDIPTIPTKTSQLTNDSGFLKEIPSEYVTETELTNKSFAKQSDLDTTNSKVQENANAISDINSSLSSKADKAALDTVSNNVTTIQGKIPTQASATNKLADKEFVNSSISTATATFRGTVDSVDSLPTTGVDINDYAFVRATDSSGNTLYQRYKYNGSQWAFEYELNNSSFTSEQWATINSGLTKDYVDSADLNTISSIIAEVENLLKDKADNSAIPTKVSQLDNDRGFISSYTETDPTVPDWAKASKKPEYDYSEIKNTPTIPDTSNFVNKTGDTMTGTLVVNATNSSSLPATTQKTIVFSTEYLFDEENIDVGASVTKTVSGVKANIETYFSGEVISVESYGAKLTNVKLPYEVVLEPYTPDGYTVAQKIIIHAPTEDNKIMFTNSGTIGFGGVGLTISDVVISQDVTQDIVANTVSLSLLSVERAELNTIKCSSAEFDTLIIVPDIDIT